MKLYRVEVRLNAEKKGARRLPVNILIVAASDGDGACVRAFKHALDREWSVDFIAATPIEGGLVEHVAQEDWMETRFVRETWRKRFRRDRVATLSL